MADHPTLEPTSAATVREALAAARQGRLAKACELCERGLDDGGDPIALNALLGLLRCRIGHLDDGVRHLRIAHRGRPLDVTIACNLIAALIEQKELGSALAVASCELALSDPSLRVGRYRGFLAQTLGDYPAAIEAYEFVVERAPQDFDSWNNLGNARSAAGDQTGGIEALNRAVDLNPDAPPSRLNLAAAMVADERFDEAEEVLRRAATDFPGDSRPLADLYMLLKMQGRHQEVLPVLELAAGRDPSSAELQLKLGIEYGLVKRIEAAERAFRHAIDLDPAIVDAYLGLAIQYEHTNRETEFAPLIALAKRNRLDPGPIAFIQALEHRRTGNFEQALECLSLVPDEIEPQRSWHIRATVLDRLGRTDEAFAAFQQTNLLHEKDPTGPLERGAVLRGKLRDEIGQLTPQWLASWSPARPALERPSPIFVVGFPRSGTTLLDTILMGHPDAQVMEEEPALNQVADAIGGFEGIPNLDEAGIAAARARYFEGAGKSCDLDPHKLLIDKSPLFMHLVPLIGRLFPDARFILAARHPCDAVLSCFMSNFRLNAPMSSFLRLEDAADFYDLTFRYWERSHSLMPMRVHTVVYERLVEDVEQELRPLLDFLELDWRDEVLNHRQTARSRSLITTASYSQVTEPIYSRAVGRWQRYRKHLEPVVPILAPWARKLGYSI